MIIDATSKWVTHISTDGSGIADPKTPVPTLYGVEPAPPFHSDSILFPTTGPAWCLWEAGSLVPMVLPKSGQYRVQLSFDLMIDLNFVAHGHVVETDTIVCTPDGWNINLSTQREMVGNAMYVAGQGPGDWIPTGIVPPPLTPEVWHSHLFQYVVNQDQHTGGVEAMVIDGQLFMVPAALEGIAGINKKWTPGLLFQTQPTINGTAGSSNYMLRNIKYALV